MPTTQLPINLKKEPSPCAVICNYVRKGKLQDLPTLSCLAIFFTINYGEYFGMANYNFLLNEKIFSKPKRGRDLKKY